MFAFSSVRCKGCNAVFCCAAHRKIHQKSCKSHQVLAHKAAVNKPILGQPTLPVQTGTMVVIGSSQSRNLKRKCSQPVKNLAGVEVRSSLAPSQRKFKPAVRGKFRNLQKSPTLESVREEDESSVDPEVARREGHDSSSAVVGVAKPFVSAAKNSDPYKDFVTGTTKDSPIEIIKGRDEFVGSPPESCDGDGPQNMIGSSKSPVEVVPPTATPSNSGLKTQMPPRTSGAPPWLTPNVFGGFKTSTPKDLDGEQAASTDAGDTGPQLTDESPRVMTAVVTPLATPVETQSAKRTFAEMRESSTPYYSAQSSFSPSPLPVNELLLSDQGAASSSLASGYMATIPGPSILESVRSFFKHLVCRTPGNTEKTPDDGMDSQARKRIKVLANSRIQCRPTYRGRYKKSPSHYE